MTKRFNKIKVCCPSPCQQLRDLFFLRKQTLAFLFLQRCLATLRILFMLREALNSPLRSTQCREIYEKSNRLIDSWWFKKVGHLPSEQKVQHGLIWGEISPPSVELSLPKFGHKLGGGEECKGNSNRFPLLGLKFCGWFVNQTIARLQIWVTYGKKLTQCYWCTFYIMFLKKIHLVLNASA